MNSTEDNTKSPLLFRPLKLRGITFKNRICVSPMCQYSCEDGFVNDWHLVNAGSFATGGAGLVMIEGTGVEAIGRLTPGCTGIWKDEHIEPMARIVKFVKSQGCVPGIQLCHGGRKASTKPLWIGHDHLANEEGGWDTIGATDQAFGGPLWKVPKAATIEDIDRIMGLFVSSAKRALKAGFEVIDLHMGHGYFISEFLSPIANNRTDKYGGSFENRIRFGLEVAEAVREVLPDDIVLGARLSVTDYVDNGWDVSQSVEFAKRLKQIGVDFMDCSSGGLVASVNYNPLNTGHMQVEAAATIQKGSGLPTAAVGQIVDPLYAEHILNDKGAELVFMGRAFLNNPHWPYHAADVLGADEHTFQFPTQYGWCIGFGPLAKFSQWRKTLNNQG